MYTLLIRGEPFELYQFLYVFKDDERIERIGVLMEDLETITFSLIAKYHIKQINLSGIRSFMEGIEKQIKDAGITTYSIDNLIFKHV